MDQRLGQSDQKIEQRIESSILFTGPAYDAEGDPSLIGLEKDRGAFLASMAYQPGRAA
ncbi:MAG: hypothetical protein JO110_03290 [Acetobacteraceae bacterium]|nr:hypothetical protein [Acetobacteraceae bacterium]